MQNTKIANYRPIVLSAICLMLGILAGALTRSTLVGFGVLLTVLIVGCIASFFLKYKTLKIATVFLLVGFVLMSLTCFTAYTERINLDKVYIEGRVKEISNSTTYNKKYVVEDIDLLGEELSGKAILESNISLNIGDKVLAYGSFENIEFDPFDSYSISKHGKKIYYCVKATECEKIGESRLSLIEKVKVKIRNLYNEELGEEEGAIALGLVLGDTSGIDYNTSNDMRASGLSHLFSVSGLHVGFMSTIIFYLFRLLKVEKKKSILWVAIILLIYGFLTGFPVGVVRASIMSMLILFAEITSKRYDQLNGLALAVIILLLINPLDLFSVSFLLSVSAMFGIACFYQRMVSLYQGDSLMVKKLLGSVAVSLSANAFVVPVSAYYFGTVSVYFVLANLVVVPIASLVYFLLVPFTLLALIIPHLGILIAPLGTPILLVSLISSAIGKIPFATLNLSMPMVSALLYSFGFVVLSRYYMGSKWYKITISVLSFIACALVFFIN